MSDHAILLPKWFTNGGIILAKGQLINPILLKLQLLRYLAQSQILGNSLYIAYRFLILYWLVRPLKWYYLNDLIGWLLCSGRVKLILQNYLENYSGALKLPAWYDIGENTKLQVSLLQTFPYLVWVINQKVNTVLSTKIATKITLDA